MKMCTKCGVEKEDTEFYIQKVINKTGVKYYLMPPCKECRGVKKKQTKKPKKISTKNIDVTSLRDEIRNFIKAIVRRGGLVNEVDFFKIAHYHLMVFGFRASEDKCEIISNWQELHKWYLDDEPLEMTICLECDNIRPSIEMVSGKRCNQCTAIRMKAYRANKKT
jgi:hypothetical protein